MGKKKKKKGKGECSAKHIARGAPGLSSLHREEGKGNGLPHYLVRDAGRTQIPPGQSLSWALVPASVEDIDKITEGMGSLHVVSSSSKCVFSSFFFLKTLSKETAGILLNVDS